MKQFLTKMKRLLFSMQQLLYILNQLLSKVKQFLIEMKNLFCFSRRPRISLGVGHVSERRVSRLRESELLPQKDLRCFPRHQHGPQLRVRLPPDEGADQKKTVAHRLHWPRRLCVAA
jgi:hypothetical protein